MRANDRCQVQQLRCSVSHRSSFISRLSSAFICASLIALSGCGQAGRTEPVVKLEGNVSISGKPLPADAEGTVIFMPAALGEAPPAQAKIVGGHYKAEKVAKGQVLATFQISRLTGNMLKTSPDDIHPTPERIDLVPKGSRAGVKFEVQSDSSSQNFDLK